MTMCLEITTLGRQHIEAVLGYPPLIWRVLAPDEPGYFWYEVSQFTQLMRFPQRNQLVDDTAPAPDFDYVEGEGIREQFGKAWHGLHYLLTHSVWGGKPPMNFIINGGVPVPETDTGYGPVRMFDECQTQTIATAISKVDQVDLFERFDCQEWMALAIYPVEWESWGRDESIVYLRNYLMKLQSFIFNAAEHNLGLVMYVS
ncbi:YfbM family protein [Endozoicomonas sp. SM1973]|uniref:YfbM family protein n=1 Tax=Spartinivicinus marinus TaxID=2994442 RepID=A0A853IJ05_9GAMM|nr:YfbM family protein [Spartinivicinus marinus]MCX4024605.1 YfbM family protein [Spartinivicinus marinus]NYZ69387.1 YfbM family protein [Spartinivicinus marinus]